MQSYLELLFTKYHMYVYNPFGGAPEDFDLETAGSRIGERIRTIRKEEGLSQGCHP